jgi:2-oxoglutarate ferredoxin oxidoreductase subunit alpha
MPLPDINSLKIINRDRAEISSGNGFRRYAVTPDGVSPMSLPGQISGEYVAESVEHDEKSRPNYGPHAHSEMTAKRYRKLTTAERELAHDPLNVTELPDQRAELAVIGWGSTEGAIHEAILRTKERSIHVRWMQCRLLNPLPKTQLSEFLDGAKRILVPELNYASQFGNLLRAHFNIDLIPLNKAEGLPFTPDEILRKIEELA